MTLKVPIAFATKFPGLGTTIKWVADRIETVSRGSIKMKLYEPGKLVAPFETLVAVSTGKVIAGYTAAGYWAGKYPLHRYSGRSGGGPVPGVVVVWKRRQALPRDV